MPWLTHSWQSCLKVPSRKFEDSNRTERVYRHQLPQIWKPNDSSGLYCKNYLASRILLIFALNLYYIWQYYQECNTYKWTSWVENQIVFADFFQFTGGLSLITLKWKSFWSGYTSIRAIETPPRFCKEWKKILKGNRLLLLPWDFQIFLPHWCCNWFMVSGALQILVKLEAKPVPSKEP